MNIAVCLPSRGLIHSRTIESIQCMDVPSGVTLMQPWHISHDLPIPDAHNYVATQGMAAGADALMFVEEDNILHPQSLAEMLKLLEAGYDWAFVDYPLLPDRPAPCYYVHHGEVIFTGMGSTLIHRRVFAGLPYPWFSSNARITITPEKVQFAYAPNPYGGQDVYLAHEARKIGYRIGVVQGIVGKHAKLKQPGKLSNNHGVHEIEIWETWKEETADATA